MAPAGGGERLAMPASPSVAQPEAADAGHEVELGRVGQAQPDRVEAKAIGAKVDVVDIQGLGDRVVPADAQPDPVQLEALDLDVLIPRNVWRSSPSWSRPQSPMPRAGPSSPRHAVGSSLLRTKRAAASSATCTTGCSSSYR
jgi:hypothetical protein